MKDEKRDWKDWLAMGCFMLLAWAAIAATGIALAYAMQILRGQETFLPEIALPILLISGVGALLLLLSTVAIVFAALRLSDRNQALGLPEGSVRAVIALSLILIFVISALYLYSNLRQHGVGQVYTSTGLSKEMVEAWLEADDDIVSVDIQEGTGETVYDVVLKVGGEDEERKGLSEDEYNKLLSEKADIVSFNSREEAGEKVYDVRQAVGQSEASENFASQVLTTVSTLVVALAGFYFGTRAVATARGEAVSSQPAIRSIEPGEGKQGQTYEVTILGKNFESPKEVKLVRGSEKMVCTDIMSSATKIECKLVVDKGPDEKKWALVVVNADGGQDQLDDAFAVTVTVPDLVKDGKTTKAEAAKQLEAEGLKPKWEPADAADEWIVVSHKPLKGEEVVKGSEVTVTLQKPAEKPAEKP